MTTIRSAWDWLNEAWCNAAHPSPLWPIHGRYRCPACFRTYRVAWEPRIRCDVPERSRI
jgi:hypothetical protein